MKRGNVQRSGTEAKDQDPSQMESRDAEKNRKGAGLASGRRGNEAELRCATPLLQFAHFRHQVMGKGGFMEAQLLGYKVWESGASPIVSIGQLEPGSGQLDVLLADNKGQDLLIG